MRNCWYKIVRCQRTQETLAVLREPIKQNKHNQSRAKKLMLVNSKKSKFPGIPNQGVSFGRKMSENILLGLFSSVRESARDAFRLIWRQIAARKEVLSEGSGKQKRPEKNSSEIFF